MQPKAISAAGITALLSLLVASCSGNGSVEVPNGQAARSTADVTPSLCASLTPPPAETQPASRAQAVSKKPMRGLIDLGQVSAVNMPEPPYNTVYYACQRPQAISGIVVNATWANLQPHGKDSPVETGAIDGALSQIIAYNEQPEHHLAVRLRIWTGIDAPVWAKRIGGPISICDGNAVPQTTAKPQGNAAPKATPTPCPAVAIRTVGAFWSLAYAAAWDNLQSQLAKRYDADVAVNEVAISSCSSLTSEPFVQPEDGYSKEHLINAGYTDAKYRQCLSSAVGRDYAPFWHQTPLDYSFNPFREIQPTPPETDLAFTEATIDKCRTAIGERCVLLNETMAKFTPPPSPAPGATPSTAQAYYEMWSYMKSRGGEITFQSASPPNLLAAWATNRAGWNAAVQLASGFGASSIELFPPKGNRTCMTADGWIVGYTCFPRSAADKWASEFRR
jgi:hypothetical protein